MYTSRASTQGMQEDSKSLPHNLKPAGILQSDVRVKRISLASGLLPHSTKIQTEPGPLETYKLPTIAEEDGKEFFITCNSEDGKPQNMPERRRVILLVGATGSGKTIFINGMANYLFGVQWKGDYRFKLMMSNFKITLAQLIASGPIIYVYTYSTVLDMGSLYNIAKALCCNREHNTNTVELQQSTTK